MATSPSSTATGGTMANARLNMWITRQFLPGVFGRCSALKWAMQENLPKNADTTTLAIPGLQQVHDYDTLPTPTYDGGNGVGPNEPDLEEFTNFKITAELKQYMRKFGVPKTTIDTSSKELPRAAKKVFEDMIVAEVMKLHWEAFQSLSASYRRLGGDVASASLVVTKMTMTDIAAACEILEDSSQPITEMVMPDKDYGTQAKNPTRHLTIHPHQLYALVQAAKGTSGYSWKSAAEIASNGGRMIANNHVGTIPELFVDVFVDDFIRRQYGVAAAATSGMRQNGGVDVLYNAVLQGADSICVPSLGAKIEASASYKVGGGENLTAFRGVESGYFPPVRTAERVNPRAIFWYDLWFATALLYTQRSDGTQKYRAVELINTANDPS